jgi:hypothetical protein
MMRMNFDWRWVGLIAILIVVTAGNRIPAPLVALALGGAGGYLLWEGWKIWSRSGGRGSGRRVVYWRGQRVEMGGQSRRPALPSFRGIGPAAIYLLLGGVLSLAALSLVFRQLGM